MADQKGIQLKYFVLKPAGTSMHAHASRIAMDAYADIIKGVDMDLARALRTWARRETLKAQGEGDGSN